MNRHGTTEEEQTIWKFVGGKVEENEIGGENSLENTAKRKVLEEMGIEIDNLVPIKPMLIPHPTKPNLFVVLIHYLAERVGEIKPGDEIVEYGWFNIENLPENCAPNIKPVIEEYKKNI